MPETKIQMARRLLDQCQHDLMLARQTGDKKIIRNLENEEKERLRKLDKLLSEEAKNR